MEITSQISIVTYKPEYLEAFRDLNVNWIATFFEMEKADFDALNHPQEYIIDKGGVIFVALYNDEPVGVCALIKMNHPEFDYEMAKMAVSPKAQGKGIGLLLGKTIIEWANQNNASTIYLESNTQLRTAIHLYHKLGFQEITGYPSSYDRVDIQMALRLKDEII